jgi:hypothetical protein
MLKDAAINWVRANCRDPKLRADFTRKLSDVLQRRVACWFAIGQALTRERQPYMIHCFADELFIFQLSLAQAKGLMLAPDAMCSSFDPRPTAPRQKVLPRMLSISQFELDKPALTEADRITGSVAYELESELPPSLCLRLDCSLGLSGDETSWVPLDLTAGPPGRAYFSFAPLRESVWPLALMHRGPLAVFLRVCIDSNAMVQRYPISNTCGTLIDIG